jgi:vitamin-K-epoxide reductase (warfarin-sensitive)
MFGALLYRYANRALNAKAKPKNHRVCPTTEMTSLIRKILVALIVVLCIIGIVVASLALREHYNTGTSPCDINEKWDCGAVNHSPYAVLYGVPVAVIGIAGYALIAILVWRFPWFTVVAALGGLIFSLRLTWLEWKELQVWCIYCVSSQGIIAVVFLLTLIAAWLYQRGRRKIAPQATGN